MRGEFVDLAGKRLYYYAAGSRGVGDPVILLHGFPTSSRLWADVVRDFPAGHRLVVADLPGFGRSEATPATPATCATHAAAVRALLDELGIERAGVVGHGLGGGVAQALAVQWPERVSSLTLVASTGFGVRPRRLARLARLLRPVAPYTPPGLLAGLVHGGVRRGFAHREANDLTLEACLMVFTTRAGRSVLADHLRALTRCDTELWSARLGELRIPAAVIWGRDDPFYPVALGERLAAAIPGATFEVLDGAAHFVPADRPEELRRGIVGVLDKGER